MIDINIIRTNRQLVIDNLKKKYQESKLPLLDEITELDKKVRELKINGDSLRQERNKTSDEIGLLYREKKTEEANLKKERVKEINNQLKFNCNFDNIRGTIFFTYKDLVPGKNAIKDEGLATLLVEKISFEMKEQKKKVALFVKDSNEFARRAYEKAGFSPISKFCIYYY